MGKIFHRKIFQECLYSTAGIFVFKFYQLITIIMVNFRPIVCNMKFLSTFIVISMKISYLLFEKKWLALREKLFSITLLQL